MPILMQVYTHTHACTHTGVFQGEFCRHRHTDAHIQVFQGKFWTRRTYRRLLTGVSRQNSYEDRLVHRLTDIHMDAQSVSRRMQRLVDTHTDTDTRTHTSGVFQGKRAQTNMLTLADIDTQTPTPEKEKHFNAKELAQTRTLARAYLHTQT